MSSHHVPGAWHLGLGCEAIGVAGWVRVERLKKNYTGKLRSGWEVLVALVRLRNIRHHCVSLKNYQTEELYCTPAQLLHPSILGQVAKQTASLGRFRISIIEFFNSSPVLASYYARVHSLRWDRATVLQSDRLLFPMFCPPSNLGLYRICLPTFYLVHFLD